MANLVRSLLLYGMFDYRTIQRDGQWVQEFKASVHESAQPLQQIIREGQCLMDDLFHNASWYNRLGEKLGWGDLSGANIQQIRTCLPAGELFIIVSERAPFWDLSKDLDPMNPGIDFLVKHAEALITPLGQCYVFPSEFADLSKWDLFSETSLRGRNTIPARRQTREWLKSMLDVANRTEINLDERLIICPNDPTKVEELLPEPWCVGENWSNTTGQKMADGRWELGIYDHRDASPEVVEVTGLYALDDCVNWNNNPRGDCGGRMMTRGEVIICETCLSRLNQKEGE